MVKPRVNKALERPAYIGQRKLAKEAAYAERLRWYHASECRDCGTLIPEDGSCDCDPSEFTLFGDYSELEAEQPPGVALESFIKHECSCNFCQLRFALRD